jgi:hypothetical protein
MNGYGELGFPQSYKDSLSSNAQANLPPSTIFANTGIVGAYEIAAGGEHSLILASNVKPSGNNFTIIRPNGYPSPTNLTIYPIDQIAQ